MNFSEKQTPIIKKYVPQMLIFPSVAMASMILASHEAHRQTLEACAAIILMEEKMRKKLNNPFYRLWIWIRSKFPFIGVKKYLK